MKLVDLASLNGDDDKGFGESRVFLELFMQVGPIAAIPHARVNG